MIETYNYPPDLPWGYWLQTHPQPDGGQTIVMGNKVYDGGLRHVFWEHRLNMCACLKYDEQLDMLHVALDRLHRLDDDLVPAVVLRDIFCHDGFWQHYCYWLNSSGLTWHGRHPLDSQRLTPEGRAVRLMLRMTSALSEGAVPRQIAANRGAAKMLALLPGDER